MPLSPGASHAVIGSNIREMIASGFPQRQAVAAALSNARRHPRNSGGIVGYDDGGQISPAGFGGIAPSVGTQNPLVQSEVQRYSGLSPEKLQELSVRLGGSQQGQLVQHLLEQKRLSPNQAPSNPVPAGPTMSRGGPLGYASGGEPLGVSSSMAAPWWTRSAASADDRTAAGGGFLHGTTGGRADQIETSAPAGSHIIPADVISGLGDGNSLAGARIFDEVMHSLPWGVQAIPQHHGSGPPRASITPVRRNQARGGTVSRRGKMMPVALSHGERVVSPQEVLHVGSGNEELGHRRLDAWIMHERKKNIEKQKKLKPPVGMKK